MSDANEPRWVHTCSRCGVTEPTDRCEEECPVCQVAMAADKLQPSPDADELARKQRVVDAIGAFMAKPPKPIIPRRWRRPGFR